MQLTVKHFGGEISRGTTKEYGKMAIHLQNGCPLFAELPETQDVWMSHGDHVSRLPEGFQLAAKSDNGLIASAFDAKRKFYLVQFHPEVHGSVYGREILQNFLFRVCQVKADWRATSTCRCKTSASKWATRKCCAA